MWIVRIEMSETAVTVEHIEVTPNVCFGKPRIVGTRISVADVALMYLCMGQSLEEIAGKYNLSLASVHAAMAYYYDHREYIELRRDREDAFAEKFRQNHVSPLEEKLQKNLDE
jgi:uncharacterized protein (DUF433 family)